MERFTSVLRSAVQEARLLMHIRFDEGTPISRTISSSRSVLNLAGPDRFTFPTQQKSRNSFSDNQSAGPDAYDSTPETTKEQPFKCVFSFLDIIS